MAFDHHDPEIERMMWERACAQGDTLVAENPAVARHHERRQTDALEHYKRLAEEMDRLFFETPFLNRLRHGAAATCPKHGPTKGGLCRRCTRGGR